MKSAVRLAAAGLIGLASSVAGYAVFAALQGDAAAPIAPIKLGRPTPTQLGPGEPPAGGGATVVPPPTLPPAAPAAPAPPASAAPSPPVVPAPAPPVRPAPPALPSIPPADDDDDGGVSDDVDDG